MFDVSELGSLFVLRHSRCKSSVLLGSVGVGGFEDRPGRLQFRAPLGLVWPYFQFFRYFSHNCLVQDAYLSA